MPSALHLRPSLHFHPNVTPNSNPNPRNPLPVGARRSQRRRVTFVSSLSTPQSLRGNLTSRYAVLGAGFAGLSVAWHLLKHSPKESHISIDIFDENGVGGGASGASGGLLHPYSPKAKLLWRGAECWKECLQLLGVAEQVTEAAGSNRTTEDSTFNFDRTIVWRRGILRPATSEKNVEILMENAQSCLQSCTLEALDKEAAECLMPGLCVPLNFAIYMPLAMNIHPRRYLQALFVACQNLVDELSASSTEKREINMYKESVTNLHQLSGDYDAVIICLGAKVDMLPELAGKLPLRTCRGVVAEFQLPSDTGYDMELPRGEVGYQSPSILSDAWLAFQDPRCVFVGSTWEWKSRNYESSVSDEEASRAMEELLPKASAIYPEIIKWTFIGARAGLRAMPPVTPHGSLPLLGCLNSTIGEMSKCRYWLIGGLGSRGLLYHGLVGKLTAQAVISSNEDVIPSEFTSWKKMKI